MISVLGLLDNAPLEDGFDLTVWFARIEQSLSGDYQAWRSAVVSPNTLSKGQGWALLGWIEVAASEVVRNRSREILVSAVFAMALVLRSPLDTRDCAVVAALLRRASALAGLDYRSAVAEGCARAGEPDGDARRLFETASEDVPSTHIESGEGKSFKSVRLPSDIDIERLEQWLESGNPW
ncbi:hypothetical protein M2152_001750 [Microbacteriaceae bacterium SG_E_30_P1]|uniref:Uncharacterized protein n=1 Tax=Antiquaquibacter oligotrophicus TaxID=2880260 RepID=A0ABT6KPZ7_9MICO|nr:hypothetical protein [Antiquaquibacter oligotrophicus]MDH6181568.1 hypothetical protein [Antiquaquibacter oligotrophicus]UDF12745.1 hypothetical protein LH407_11355 [Antiquaquibacter oligotrophicus]